MRPLAQLPIPITIENLMTAKMLLRPLGGAAPSTLSEAARAVGVEAWALDLSLWRTLGGL